MSNNIYLYLKTHNKTGLKYLGKTTRDPYTYTGSGHYWKRHIAKHGIDITTEVLFETTSKSEFKRVAKEYSNKWNIIESKEFANLVNEEGDGGDTVSGKIWITNESIDKYINKDNSIPDGWRRGRSNCIFNDSEKQKEFNKRVSTENKINGMKRAWAEGRMDHRDATNIGATKETGKKISKALKGVPKSEAHKEALRQSWKKRHND